MVHVSTLVKSVNVLAIDTSSTSCILGLQVGGNVFTDIRASERSHSRDILPAISSLLEVNGLTFEQLDYIIFGEGPGSFTGLRIAVGVVQGLGYGLEIPVVPVCSLACLAQSSYQKYGNEYNVVALHARKEEVYLGVYKIEKHIAKPITTEKVLDVNRIDFELTGDWIGVGDGWMFREQLEKSLNIDMLGIDINIQLQPTALLTLGAASFKKGDFIDALSARPKYLRENISSKDVKK
ncbi:MAG: tRNA (adenosine(37)-N6)-threonylcarbamoyltransferase complex dimerization subunit type 1 TsaB [Gammaproteobacteria bacterium TMED1]|nr:MAG: tRNA (adenosine(37)-N6)-threonylcarbamoyltransferase complex dimerization subunit type 1 TsaB [Gammaproteobacteria bacterium TMED1]